MSNRKNTSVEQTTTATATVKKDKVILRKPSGTRESQGWAGEVIHSNGTREFVPEQMRENLTEQELAMTKLGNIIKAIADATNYAAQKNCDVSGIILTHGVACIQMWDAYLKVVKSRKDAKSALKGTDEEKKAKWDAIKGPLNSAVRRETLKMELYAEEKILLGEPRKAIG